MKIMIKRICIVLLIGAALVVGIHCKKPYIPPASSTNSNYLVVEGVVNAGSDTTSIRLSRTVKLTDTTTVKAEPGAIVTIESNNHAVYTLSETGNGVYTIAALNIQNSTDKWAVKIVTSDGKVYESDFVPVKNSPPIDNFGYQVKSNGVQLYSNAHDNTNNTRYYRYDYTETWIIHPKYGSQMKVVRTPVDTTVVYRDPDDERETCWITDISTSISLNSTEKLTQDVVSNNPVVFLASTSEKIEDRYRILLKQYALTKEAFEYWTNLKKNTEQLGSIFDALPSEIPGNIHCITTPSEPVIGYISVGSVSQMVTYVDTRNLPISWIPSTPYNDCELDSALFFNPKTKKNDVKDIIYNGSAFVVGPIYATGNPNPIGYTYSSQYCSDCTVRGTNKQPSFWIQSN